MNKYIKPHHRLTHDGLIWKLTFFIMDNSFLKSDSFLKMIVIYSMADKLKKLH